MAAALVTPDPPLPDRAQEHPSPLGSAALLRRLEAGPVPLAAIDAGGERELAGAYLLLHQLWRRRALVLLDRAADPRLQIEARAAGLPLDLGQRGLSGRWRLSRFAFIRDGGGGLRIETPRCPVRTSVLRPEVGGVLPLLCRPVTAEDLAGALDWIEGPGDARRLLLLLRIAGVIEKCAADGRRVEDASPDVAQWEFHDLLFHSRSRNGRHSEMIGGHYRFRGVLPPQPAVKPNPWHGRAIPLPRPELAAVAARDPTLTEVLEARRSIRDQNPFAPVSAPALGEFLFRTARNRRRIRTEHGDFVSRPYPSGGASYELELYLTLNACVGLARGFYYYDPERHALCPLRAADDEVEALLDDAWISAAQQCRPQVLITIASRFHRVNWKYSGMAYAAQLKNVGVLYQTFYLVATAMNLAGCALGLGDSERFCRLTGTNYFEEGSVGEFMLGTRLN